jgi:hypothetical protein
MIVFVISKLYRILSAAKLFAECQSMRKYPKDARIIFLLYRLAFFPNEVTCYKLGALYASFQFEVMLWKVKIEGDYRLR